MTVTDSRIVTTDEQIDAAIAASRVDPIITAVEASYDEGSDKIVICLSDDAELRLPRKKLQFLSEADSKQLSQIQIEAAGTILHWPDLDVDHYVPGLLQGIFGTRRYMQEIGRVGGSKKSAAKTMAARENAKKGGRPKAASK